MKKGSNLPFTAKGRFDPPREQDLKDAFAASGEVSSASIIKDKPISRSDGTGTNAIDEGFAFGARLIRTRSEPITSPCLLPNFMNHLPRVEKFFWPLIVLFNLEGCKEKIISGYQTSRR